MESIALTLIATTGFAALRAARPSKEKLRREARAQQERHGVIIRKKEA